MDEITSISRAALDQLTKAAKDSPRRRANLNFHRQYDDPVQRLAIAMEPDSYVRPHRHPEANKWEFFLLLRGEMDLFLFNPDGEITRRVLLCAEGEQQGMEIPPDTWHCTLARKTGTLFVEVKPGPYLPSTAKHFADWAPAEGDADVASFLTWLAGAQPGERYSSA